MFGNVGLFSTPHESVCVCVCVFANHQRPAYSWCSSVTMLTELAMQSTVDWMHEMSTTFQPDTNYSSADMITAVLKRGSGIKDLPFKAVVIATAVAGMLANLMVLVGFGLAGRSKMNVSSAYIANHTIFELLSCVNLVVRYALELDGVFKTFKYSGPAGFMFCVLFRGATLIGIGNYGGKSCIVIHTLDRYWKIVHPIHHRKYYRRWMFYVGMILPWLLGIAKKLTPAVATTRIVNGVCRPKAFWVSASAHKVSCYGLKQTSFSCIIGSFLPFGIK